MYDGTTQDVASALIWAMAIMTYLIMDFSLQGVLYIISTEYLGKWWDEMFSPINYTDYGNMISTANNNKKEKDDKVVFGGNSQAAQRLNDVWVESYIDVNRPLLGFKAERKPYITNPTLNHEWRWLMDLGTYGWRQKEPPLPPPVPTIILSEGLKDQVEEFLAGYRANEKSKDEIKLSTKETKITKLLE